VYSVLTISPLSRGNINTLAKIKLNALVESAHGRLGSDLVLKRTRSGATILAKKPEFSKNRKFSPAQREHQERFRQAVAYAKAAQANPIYVALAKKQKQPAYNVALADAMHPPRVIEIDASDYSGKVGEAIRVKAEDDVQVTRVHVAIYDARERVIEAGDAVADRAGRWWVYSTQVAVNGVSVKALAYDLAENEGSLTIQKN
jgi:hypothetical protein